jgi:hypothetical protein
MVGACASNVAGAFFSDEVLSGDDHAAQSNPVYTGPDGACLRDYGGRMAGGESSGGSQTAGPRYGADGTPDPAAAGRV